MPNLNLIKKYNRVHMLGIGGVSMSGIAEILNYFGVTVTGSDLADSEIVKKLQKNGIPVTIGHDFENLSKADIVVYSAAINSTDPEMQKAKELNIPTCERCDFLGMLTKAFNDTIGISGTHGKTTTTSLVSLCFLEAGLDPSIQVGAILKAIDGNYKVGSSEHFIIEACEYVESYLKLFPKTEVVLNIDDDHLDYFGSLDNIVKSFEKYVKLLPDNGLLVVNYDDINCRKLVKNTNAKIISYGIDTQNANFVARNITFNSNGFPTFDVYYNDNFYKTISLSVPGVHNVLNALACIGVCHEYGISKEDIKNGLLNYTGASRRFEYIGKFNDVCVFDDYGHHPTEILATANALKQKHFRESWVIFQPHTYSRTLSHLDEFAKVLLNFDNIIITDIYAAREINTYNISSKDLVNKINELSQKAIYISDFNQIVSYVKENAKPNDIVLTLGAGTITKIGPMLCNNS